MLSQIKLDREQDQRVFKRLIEELDRIEGAIDPYGDPDLLAQWSLCIANIMRASNQAAHADHSGKFEPSISNKHHQGHHYD